MNVPLLTTFVEALAHITFAIFWLAVLAVFIWVFVDIFHRRDLSGWGKAGWVLLVFVLPVIGAFIYLVARPRSASFEQEGIVAWAPQPGTRKSPAEEIAYAKQLMDQGTITQKEFEEIKQRILP
jgi:hypothetical protein